MSSPSSSSSSSSKYVCTLLVNGVGCSESELDSHKAGLLQRFNNQHVHVDGEIATIFNAVTSKDGTFQRIVTFLNYTTLDTVKHFFYAVPVCSGNRVDGGEVTLEKIFSDYVNVKRYMKSLANQIANIIKAKFDQHTDNNDIIRLVFHSQSSVIGAHLLDDMTDVKFTAAQKKRIAIYTLGPMYWLPPSTEFYTVQNIVLYEDRVSNVCSKLLKSEWGASAVRTALDKIAKENTEDFYLPVPSNVKFRHLADDEPIQPEWHLESLKARHDIHTYLNNANVLEILFPEQFHHNNANQASS